MCVLFFAYLLSTQTKIEKFPNQYFVCFAGQWWLQWTVKHQDGARWDGSTRFNEGRTGFFSLSRVVPKVHYDMCSSFPRVYLAAHTSIETMRLPHRPI